MHSVDVSRTVARAASPVETLTRRWASILAVLACATVVSRVPLRSELPFNWDSVNYLLALEDYDVRVHQPHPPGNPLYVLAGKGLLLLTGDPNQALVWTSVLFAALAVIGTAVLASWLWGREVGLWAASLVLVNPLFWVYSEVALPYTAEAVGALAVGLAAWRCRTRPGPRAALLLGVALALAGGLRPTALVLLGPLALYGLWQLRWRDRVVAGGSALVLSVFWAVPMVALSGGPVAYWRTLRALTGGQVAASSLLHGLSTEWIRNLRDLGSALTVSLVPVLCLTAYPFARSRTRPALRRDATTYLTLWAAPPLAFFASVHFGQWGYLLVIFPPALALAAALLVQGWSPALSDRGRFALLILFLSVQAGAALLLVHQAVREHDRLWRAIVPAVQAFRPEETVVLTLAERGGPFRLAGYLLPAYQVVGIGTTRDGTWGAAVVTHHHRLAHARTVDGLAPTSYGVAAGGALTRICPGKSTVVVLGAELQRMLDAASDWQRIPLPGHEAVVWHSSTPPACLDFSAHRVRLASPSAAP